MKVMVFGLKYKVIFGLITIDQNDWVLFFLYFIALYPRGTGSVSDIMNTPASKPIPPPIIFDSEPQMSNATNTMAKKTENHKNILNLFARSLMASAMEPPCIRVFSVILSNSFCVNPFFLTHQNQYSSAVLFQKIIS